VKYSGVLCINMIVITSCSNGSKLSASLPGGIWN